MKQKKISIVRVVLSAFMGMLLLTGCGEGETVDYSIEGVAESEQPQEENGKIGLTQFAGEDVWKDTFKIRGEGSVEIQVNAGITIPAVNQMSVIEVTEPSFTAQYKETMVDRLFDSGEIYYGDGTHLPQKELLEIYEKYDVLFSYSADDYDFVFHESATGQQYQDDIWNALGNVEEAKETYTPVEDYEVNQYIGSYEGRLYTLSFAESPGEHSLCREKQMIWEVKDLYEVCPEKYKELENPECSAWMQRGERAENACELSEEDALKQAKAFVEKLGLDYPVFSNTRPLVWGTVPEYISETEESEEWGVNGYVFFFDLGVDELSFVSYGVENDYAGFWSSEEKEEMHQYSLQSQLQIYVTDKGIIRVVANNPLEITSIQEDVELLSLDTAKGIIKETVEERWETIRTSTSNAYSSNFDAMELIYFRVRDKENPGRYSYVPTWRLGNVTKDTVLNQITIRNPVLINAIDGSWIDVYDET